METIPYMNAAPTKEGRVNVPLGNKERALSEMAKRFQTTKTALARVIILEGMERIERGQMVFRSLGLEPVTSPTP